jgi:hypothetical protein
MLLMSTSAISEALEQMSPEERFFAAAWLHHRSQADDEEWRREMQRTQADMDAGRKFSHEQVNAMHDAMHDALNAAGA